MVLTTPETSDELTGNSRPERRKELIQNYQPQPIDVEDVHLDDDLMALSELLAKNVHEVWSAARLAEGWQYGEERDDSLKLHPCLVPYSLLPEEEKRLDRLTALNTLRVLGKFGFTISRGENGTGGISKADEQG